MSEKVSFECDYNNGVVPEIMQRFIQTNQEKTSGYGLDKYTHSAQEKIRQQWACHKLKSSSSSAERKPMQQ